MVDCGSCSNYCGSNSSYGSAHSQASQGSQPGFQSTYTPMDQNTSEDGLNFNQSAQITYLSNEQQKNDSFQITYDVGSLNAEEDEEKVTQMNNQDSLESNIIKVNEPTNADATIRATVTNTPIEDLLKKPAQDDRKKLRSANQTHAWD
jgi:hypothetical protein